ncbi:MAG TPA: helix-turn-helix transcriptional regulator [Candidatus Limnocylindria bacterium]
MLVGAFVVFVELHLPTLEHGTHLLLALLVVIGAALSLGPGPSAVALAVGGIGSGAASVATLGPHFTVPDTLTHLAGYLLAGMTYLGLLSLAVRSRALQPGTSPGFPPAALNGGVLNEPLTPRETEILRLAAAGMSVAEIGRRLYLSPNTVKSHLSHLYAKLGARNRSQAIRAALHCGCLTSTEICPHHPNPTNG